MSPDGADDLQHVIASRSRDLARFEVDENRQDRTRSVTITRAVVGLARDLKMFSFDPYNFFGNVFTILTGAIRFYVAKSTQKVAIGALQWRHAHRWSNCTPDLAA